LLLLFATDESRAEDCAKTVVAGEDFGSSLLADREPVAALTTTDGP